MISVSRFLMVLLAGCLSFGLYAADPLRVFIRAGVKTHGPNQHDHPRFLGDWTQFLGQRGIQVNGSMTFPTAEQLNQTDVVVIYAADGMKIVGEERTRFEAFLKRGGGVVVIHDGVVSGDQHEWAKKVQGGAWRWDGEPKAKWYEGEVGMYFVQPEHPIVAGLSNFDWKDEIYHDLDMDPDANVLATSFHSVFVIAPQIWTFEKTWEGGSAPFRSFVSLPGHEYDVFNTPHYRAILLRGIAWAGKRADISEFCRIDELAQLKYPEGGPTAPEKAGAHLGMHPDFELSLVVSEPLVEKVISLDWDAHGRLWVAETPEYPGGRTINRNDAAIALRMGNTPALYGQVEKENRPARDRISWLEDTNGDGTMDRKHVFADGLELVTSLVLHGDGVIVAQAPEILWLRDRNGDGVCDMIEGSEKFTLYTGFGAFDTHAVINNFRWGLDGWVYGAIGYSAGTPRSLDGSKNFGRLTAGIIRFKPDGSMVEQVASGSCNTWGFDFAPDGEMFYTTATCGEHFLHVVLPEKVLALGNVGGVRAFKVVPDHQDIEPAVKHTRPAYVQIDWVGKFTAAAGCAIYNGGAWPESWNNHAFLSETTMSLVHNDVFRKDGVSYISSKEAGREDTEFIAGSDLWFRPIHTRVGPDGALYVVDFYNQAAIHNDTRGPAHGARNAATRPDRDHHFSRVWRVQHRQAKPIVMPKLASREPSVLIAALKSPNGWVRDTATRILREDGFAGSGSALEAVVKNQDLSGPSRISALHALASGDAAVPGDVLMAALRDPDPVLRKNALRVVAERDNSDYTPGPEGVRALLRDPEPRVRLNALVALATCNITVEAAGEVVAAWPTFEDKWTQSAAVALASKAPDTFLAAAFQSADPAFAADYVGHIARVLANRQDAAVASSVIRIVAQQPARTDGLKQTVIETLARTLRADVNPPWTVSLAGSFRALLESAHPGLPGAVLPLVARWDRDLSLSPQLRPVISGLLTQLNGGALSDDQRGQIAANLLGVRAIDRAIVPAVGGIVDSQASQGLQRQVITALGSTGDRAALNVLLERYSKLGADLREVAFGEVIKRPDWSLALVEALSTQAIEWRILGPANLHRLRTHADKGVSERAIAVLDLLRGPEMQEKEAMIAKYLPEVEKTGADLAKGRTLFMDNCAACHRYKEDGAEFAPNLTGMGAHGPEDMLVHILDPNRVVEPNFISVSVETQDDLILDGIVLRENRAVVVLRNQTGEYEIQKNNIRTRTATGRSLMPEGFEQLGAEGLRDLIGYLSADDLNYRIVDLTGAFTADSSAGIYVTRESRAETLRFREFGTRTFKNVPFDVVSPGKSPTGNNVLVLKGGEGMAKTYPASVEVKAGFAASALHFLGGVGGWAFPWGGDRNKDLPVLKVTLFFEGGATEEMVMRNGVEFADYVGRTDVPGSEIVPNIVHDGRQVRYFARPVQGTAKIDRIRIESFNNTVAPTLVGLTAELRGVKGSSATSSPAQPAASSATPVPAAAAVATPAPAVPVPVAIRPGLDFKWGAGLKALLVGGGSSHDFHRFFNLADRAILEGTGKVSANYTEITGGLGPVVPTVEVLCLSNNKPFEDSASKQAIFDHVRAGKGVVLIHAALWQNWNDWAEFNREIAGGAARGHDRFGEFEVTVTDPDHPMMAGLPAKFSIADELYWFEPTKEGSEIKVLATAFSKQRNRTYPIIFEVLNPQARIAAISLGHDGQAHSHPVYKQLLVNSVMWSTGK